ncbi:MAG: M28 family peptidase [Balneolaceae bacterium]
MKPIIPLFFFIAFTGIAEPSLSRQADTEKILTEVTQTDAEMNIYFLSSDELRGRDTGTHELDIAARYIATWFRSNGIRPIPEQESYFQDVPLRLHRPAVQAVFILEDSVYTLNEDIISMNKPSGTVRAPVVYLQYATQEEIAEHDVEGKIVITSVGFPGQSTPGQFISASRKKIEDLSGAGAAGLVELYVNRQYSWRVLVNYASNESVTLDPYGPEKTSIPHIWFNAMQKPIPVNQIDGKSAEITIEGPDSRHFTSRNVLGFVEGADPDLKEEIILLSAHYDHTGVAKNREDGNYIFNGARDNAVGISAIMQAARYLAQHPPRRSILIAAWTAEEKGLLGSGWFAENPQVPLNKIVYNLNIDGAGYNDTTKVTVIGLERTGASDELTSAAEAFGLEAIGDPAPEQNLFDRSDNVNFAQQGIPSPTYSMGFTAFDDEINYYYHRVTDEPDTINYDYVTSYIRSYVLAVIKVANREEAPFWLPGDVYEEAGIELYGRE